MMNTEEYRKHPALNFSLAKHLLTSPAHFRAAADEEVEPSEAMVVGTLAHSMVLEGKNLLDMYAIKPKGMSFATAEGKFWKAQQTKPILKEEDATSIPGMAGALAENPDAHLILANMKQRETPYFATIHGVECKALLDLHGESPGGLMAIGDFKTSADVSPWKFEKVVYDMDYDMQMSWYSMILATSMGIDERPLWFWIACEKKRPFANAVYRPDWDVVESGDRKVQKALDIYKSCMESGVWPMPYRGVKKLNLPRYAGKETE